jgi:apolipoprotein N-acyltransferase
VLLVGLRFTFLRFTFYCFQPSCAALNNIWTHPFLRSRYFVAILGGLLWTGAFPRLELAGLAWVAPGLIVAAGLGKRGGEQFRLGYVAGLTHYLSMLYWLLLIPYRWHGLPLGPAAGWLALSGFLAVFPAVWAWLISPAENQGEIGKGVLARNWFLRTAWALSGAAMWVGWEMIVARVFGGFPWALLGVSQYRMVPLIQMAAVTGVYGISFMVVWTSLALLSGGLLLLRRPTLRSVWLGEIFLPLLTVAVTFSAGLRHVKEAPTPARTVRLMLVQPSIPQTVIWDEAKEGERFAELLRQTEQALSNQVDVLVWPESALPNMVRYDTNTLNAVVGLARRHKVWIILCSDDAEPHHDATTGQKADYFNSSFLVTPEGILKQRYVKRNLVIFGEYLPLAHWLPFLKIFTPIEGGFTPGTNGVEFHLPEVELHTSVLICFEDVFPHLARLDISQKTDFLVNLTNDGWFGESAEQWQHALTALFRSVENGVPLIRCCNNGLTCWSDAQGRLRQVLRDDRGTIYGKGFLLADIPLPRARSEHALTFYSRHGDCFGWMCVAVTAAVLAWKLAFRWSMPVSGTTKKEPSQTSMKP